MTNHEIQQPTAPTRGQFHEGLEAAERAGFTRPVKAWARNAVPAGPRERPHSGCYGPSGSTSRYQPRARLKRTQKTLRAAMEGETARD
jgi:hypothetical protein